MLPPWHTPVWEGLTDTPVAETLWCLSIGVQTPPTPLPLFTYQGKQKRKKKKTRLCVCLTTKTNPILVSHDKVLY